MGSLALWEMLGVNFDHVVILLVAGPLLRATAVRSFVLGEGVARSLALD